MRTVAVAVVRNRLLSTSEPSREIGWNMPPCRQASRAQRKQCQRSADEHGENAQNEHAAARVGRKSMHRRQNAGAHQECAEKRQRECEDRQKQRPDLQRRTLFHDDRRVQQRRSCKPRHEGGILHRVPEPQAAPPELIVSPVGAHRDALSGRPRQQRPGPNPPRPGGIYPAFE